MSEEEIAAIARAATPSLGFYAGVIALALIAPKVAVSDTSRSRSWRSCVCAVTGREAGNDTLPDDRRGRSPGSRDRGL